MTNRRKIHQILTQLLNFQVYISTLSNHALPSDNPTPEHLLHVLITFTIRTTTILIERLRFAS